MDRFELESRRSALIQEIETVFDGVSREGGISLHEAAAMDAYSDREEARLKDTEDRWQDVPEDVLRQQGRELAYLDNIGFRYYLPAILTWVLRHLHGTEESPEGSRGWNTYSLSLLFDLNPRRATDSSWQENHMVAKFLQFMEDLFQLEQREYANQEYLREAGRAMTEVEFQESYLSSYESEEGELLRTYWYRFLEPNQSGKSPAPIK